MKKLFKKIAAFAVKVWAAVGKAFNKLDAEAKEHIGQVIQIVSVVKDVIKEGSFTGSLLDMVVEKTTFPWDNIALKKVREWLPIRENLDLAESVGISAFRYKLVAFLMGAGLAGLVGALYTHYIGFVSPKIVDTWINVVLAAMVIIGGEGTLLGPIVGAFLLTVLPEVLRFAEGYRMLLFGVILLVVIMFAPQGIVGLAADLVGKRKRG